MKIYMPDIPRDQNCQKINPELFKHFQIRMFKLSGNLPNSNWTEANVIQWLDLEDNKYMYEQLDKNIR